LKATARDIFFSCRNVLINSASYEYKNMSANKGAQFIPMGIPTLLEDLPPNNYINIVYEEFQHLFNFNFGVVVCLESE
jgi:hypothetical protein